MKLSFKRSTKEKNADAKGKLPNNNTNVDWQIADFNYYAKYCSNRIASIVLQREDAPVYPNIKPGHLRQYLDATAPIRPQSFKNIIDDFFTYILPLTAHWNHSKFAAYYPAGNAFANIYGDMLSTAFGGVGFSWTAQPSLTELENVMMDWFARALRLPVQFIFSNIYGKGGGCTHNTASDAIYTTIVAARHIKLKEAGCYPDSEKPHHTKSEAPPHPGITLEKLVAYTSSEAHCCVEKGCRIAMCTLRILEPDANLSLQGKTIEQAVRNDIRKGLIPFYCCGTLGTPGTCDFDDIFGLGEVCQKYDLYYHVDAAYAGNAMILPQYEWLQRGLLYANSISINPYKLLLGALDLSCLFVRDAKEYKAPFLIDATYLLDEFENESDKDIKRNEIDYRHYGIALSRRMRSLKLFFLFRMHGVELLQEYVRDICKGAKKFEKLLKEDNRFEILNKVRLGVVVFRQKPTTANDEDDEPEDDPQTDHLTVFTETDKKNMNLVLRINRSRELHLLPCIHRKRYALRVSINYEHLNIYHIYNMVETIQKHYVNRLDTSLRNYFKRSPKITLREREISRLSFVHLSNEKDYSEFEKRQKDPSTRTIPLTFGPVFVPPSSKSAADNNDFSETEDEQSASETKTRVSKESKKWGTKFTQRFRTKSQGASNYVFDSEDDYDYDDDDN